MQDVFISFARADVESAARLAEGLRLQKISAWWDAGLRKERANRAKDAVQHLAQSRLVLCLWSSAFMRSEDRKKEAEAAKADGRLATLALRDFSWRTCPDELSDVGAAIPRLQFTQLFFDWLGRALRRKLYASDSFRTFSWASDEDEDRAAHIDFASKDILQACKSPQTRLAASGQLAEKVDQYFLMRPDLFITVERYRQRIQTLRTHGKSDQIVPFPTRLRLQYEADTKIGASRVRLRINEPDYVEAPPRTVQSKRALPSLRVISNPVRVIPGRRTIANDIHAEKSRFSLRAMSEWMTVALTRSRAEPEPPAKEIRRREDERYDIVLRSIEKAYQARSITDLDAGISEGFDAVRVEYVGLGALPPNGLLQLMERRRSDLRQARWLDVAGNVALDPDQTDHFVDTHNFRVENAFLTRVAPLHASVCAFAEPPNNNGAWRDPRQVAAIRLLSQYYVSFASILHDPLARSDIELTARQRECLQWAAIGKTDRQISDILDLDYDTVGEQIRGARGRLGVATRQEAVVEAITRGLIAPPFC